MGEDTASPRRLLTLPEVAQVLNISEKSMREHVRTRRLPFLRVGRLIRFDPGALEAWIADQQQAARNRAGTSHT